MDSFSILGLGAIIQALAKEAQGNNNRASFCFSMNFAFMQQLTSFLGILNKYYKGKSLGTKQKSYFC